MKKFTKFVNGAADDTLDELYAAAPIMMHSIDQQGVITNVSAFWLKMMGYAEAEVLGRRSVEFLAPESRRKAIEIILPRYAETGEVSGVEYDFVRADGSIMSVLMSATSVCDADGTFVKSIAVMFDNSEAIAARAALEEKKREADEANAAKLRFLAAMSHEIRTPMNAVLGFAQLLNRDAQDPRTRMKVDGIINGGNVLMKLLGDLLDLAQAETGRMAPRPEAFDLARLVDEVGDLWHSAAREKGLRLFVSVERGMATQMVADAGRIRQVLVNLLSNAIKFTREGMVTLRVEEVDGDDGTRRLRFSIADTGPGLSEDEIARLFKPFVQIDQGLQKQGGGWGIGLSVCAQIARLLDGRIYATSPEGEGCTFVFEVPVAEAPADAGAPASRGAGAPSAGGLRILVVEDNALSRGMMGEALDSLGHNALFAGDGLEALGMLETQTVDLVLMDVAMPGLDGLQTAQHIRARDDALSSVPIVAVTANSRLVRDEAYRAHGLDKVLTKPVDVALLARTIEAMTRAN